MSLTGVLLTGFGGPDSIDACGPFMCNLMGREPSEELLDRVRMRYLAIGGSSPLPVIAESIAEKLFEKLGGNTPVRVGMRYWRPYIADALQALADEGATRVVVASLSPFESKVASGACREAVQEAAASIGGLEIVEAPHVGDSEAFWAVLVRECRNAMDDAKEEGAEKPIVLFTAHSLPFEDLVVDDPYVSGVQRAASQVAVRSGLGAGLFLPADGSPVGLEVLGSTEQPVPWVLCYQSKGSRPGEWLGPMVEDVVDEIIARGEHDSVVVCPVGFLTDHLETLYDLDVEVADRVLLADLGFARAAMPNDTEATIVAIQEIVTPLL